MRKIITIGINTLQGFSSPAFSFLIVILGVKFFGKEHWASLINVMLWVFFTSFMFGWGNREHLLRAFSEAPNKMYHAFFSNFLSRCLLLPFSLGLLYFFPTKIAVSAIALVVLNFIYSSFGTLVVYHQRFGVQLVAEFVAFGIILSSLFCLDTFDLHRFLNIYIIAFSAKLLLLSLKLNFWKEPFTAKISLNEFKYGFPFFILGLSGWLLSKTDIYAVDYFLNKTQLAEYQLLITSFLMLQALAAYITIPFTKHVYRVSKKVILKMRFKLYAISLPLTIIGIFTIWFIMEYFVQLGFSFEYYILGGFLALPCFFYTLDVMELMKNHKEQIIICISSLGFLVTVFLIYLLIEPYGVFGVLTSVTISQWTVLVLYKFQKNQGIK